MIDRADVQLAVVPKHSTQLHPLDRVSVVISLGLIEKMRAQWRLERDVPLRVKPEIVSGALHLRPHADGADFAPYGKSGHASASWTERGLEGIATLRQTGLSDTTYELSQRMLVVNQPKAAREPVRRVHKQRREEPKATAPAPLATDPKMMVVTQVGTATHTLAIPASLLIELVLKYRVTE